MSVKIELYGDCFVPQHRSPTDVYRPQHLTFDNTFISDDSVEHRDVVIEWKGISFEIAKEIVFWEGAFHRALEQLVEETLIEGFLKYDKRAAEESLEEAELLVRLHQYANSYGLRKWDFPLRTLSEFMRVYHNKHGLHHPWLVGTDDFSTAIANFLRTRHCFVQDAKSQCSIPIQISAYLYDRDGQIAEGSATAASIRIIGDVVTSPHRLDFIRTTEGRLKALFEPPLLDDTCRDYPTNVTMRVTSDDGRDLEVVVTKHFPGFVRYQQDFRARLRSHTQGNLFSASRPATSHLHWRPTRDWSDIECQSEFVHPDFYNAYRDARIGKGRLNIPAAKPIEVWPVDALPAHAAVPLPYSPWSMNHGRPWTIPWDQQRQYVPQPVSQDPEEGTFFYSPSNKPSPALGSAMSPGKCEEPAETGFLRKGLDEVRNHAMMLRQAADRMLQQHDLISELLRLDSDEKSPRAQKRPPSVSTPVPVACSHISKKHKQQAPSIEASLDEATSRLTSLNLDGGPEVSFKTDDYLDFNTPRASKDRDWSPTDSLAFVHCSPWKDDDVEESYDESCIRTKPERDYCRAAGMNDFEILGVMRPWPRANSVMSMFGSPQEIPETDSDNDPNNGPDSTSSSGGNQPPSKPKVPRESPAKSDRTSGAGSGSRPISAMPAAPMMKPKRRDTAEVASTGWDREPDFRDDTVPIALNPCSVPSASCQHIQDSTEQDRLGMNVRHMWGLIKPLDETGAPQTSTAIDPKMREEEIDHEQRRIYANFEEFLARAEARRTAGDNAYNNMIGVAHDPETKEYEAIFLEDDSPSTTEISASEATSDGKSNP